MVHQKLGFPPYGFAPASQPLPGGGLWVAPPITRTPVHSCFGSPTGHERSGAFALYFNTWLASGQAPLLNVGLTVHTQYGHRDPLDLFGSGLTDAVLFTVCFRLRCAALQGSKRAPRCGGSSGQSPSGLANRRLRTRAIAS